MKRKNNHDMKRKSYLTPRLTVVATDTAQSLLITISDSVTDQPQLSKRNDWDDDLWLPDEDEE